LVAGASLTLQDPRNETTGQTLLRRAKRLGSLHVGQTTASWGWRVEAKASGRRQDIHVTSFSPTTVKGYAVVNLSGHYLLAKDLHLEGRIDNLLDRDYSLIHGYQTPGRSAYLGLNWQF
jgi:vitamin B12 transporter